MEIAIRPDRERRAADMNRAFVGFEKAQAQASKRRLATP
jgi:hypothetical protein